MKDTTTTVISRISRIAEKKNLAVYKTAFFFEGGRILPASDTKAVKTVIEALEGATTPEEVKKATASLKKAAEAAGLPEPVITAGVGKFISPYGDKYSKGLKSFIIKDPEKAFEVLKNLPDPLGLVNETVMRLFLVYKGEVLCTNPFSKTSKTGETGEEPVNREELKALLKFARIWAKHKNLTTHIGWLIKSALVPDEHGTERAAIVLDCVEDYVKDLGFLAGAKEVYYYLFNNDFTYGPVAMGNKSLIDRFNSGLYGDRFTEEEALAAALKGATSLEIAKLVGNRLGYLVAGFGCPVEVSTYPLNREDRFFNRATELDGLWAEREKELFFEQLPARDFKETYAPEMIPLAMARSLGLCPTYKWAIKTGRVAEEAMGPNLKAMLEFSRRERSLFEEYCERYNPQTPIEVFKIYQKAIIENYDETSPEAHRIALTIGELDALAKFPDNVYLKTIDADGNETVITNGEFITNLLITLEELLSDPGKLFERKNKTVDPVTREVKTAEPEILSIGKLILFDELYGFKTDKILFYEDPSDPCGVPLIDKILSGECSYPRHEHSFDQGNLSWLKAKSVFESNDDFDGENHEDLCDLYGENYDEDLDF